MFRLTIALSVVVHVLILVFLIGSSFWRIERVGAKYTPVSFVAAAALPPPPPPAAPPPPLAKRAASDERRARPVRPAEPVQPTTVDPDPGLDPDPDPAGSSEGEANGTPGGTPGSDGVPGGVPGGAGTVPSPTPPPEAPRVIPAVLLEGARVAGDPHIPLPDATKQVMAAQGVRGVDVAVRLCLSDGGVPTRVEILRSSGFAEADARIVDGMRAWRYRPYLANGRAVPLCTAVTFRYRLAR